MLVTPVKMSNILTAVTKLSNCTQLQTIKRLTAVTKLSIIKTAVTVKYFDSCQKIHEKPMYQPFIRVNLYLTSTRN